MNQFTKTFSAIIIIAFALMIPTKSFSQNGNGNQKIQLIHAADFEASTSATESAPNFAAIVQYFDKYAADNNVTSLMLLSGDNYLPGPFFSSGGDPSVRTALRTALGNPSAREDAGRVDIAICNILGVEASSIGNHEFDLGTSVLQGLISPDVRNNGADPRWMGAQFPYLSANLDFSNDGLNNVYTGDILSNTDFMTALEDAAQAPGKPSIAPATIIEKDGMRFGIVGATTPIVENISSTGGVVAKEPGRKTNNMMDLAQILQPVINQLLAQGIDKIILLAHMQQIGLEQELIGYLNGVDIVIAGGSNSILADDNDRLLPGDVAVNTYPIITENADNDPALIVNTDGSYKYVGRLIVEFDAQGKIVLGSLNDEMNGAYASDEQTVTELWGDYDTPFEMEGSKSARVKLLADAIKDVIVAKDGNTFGYTDVYLEGRRSFVRTQETNLGNLTADANLWYANQIDETVMVSHKNGGGIRAEIGRVVAVGAGDVYFLSPPLANPLAGKEQGQVSQLDIENSMRFNNGLSLITLTAEQLLQVVEHSVAGSSPTSTPGQFGQFSGIKFTFDWNLPVGNRITNLDLVDGNGSVMYQLVFDGEFVGNPEKAVRMVTLNFLAGGGDSYPFPQFQAEDPDFFNRVDLTNGEFTGLATFAQDGSEQDAFAEYMATMYPTSDKAFNKVGREGRIVNQALADGHLGEINFFELSTYHTGIFDESAAEILAYDPASKKLFFTNSFYNNVEILDITNPEMPVYLNPISLDNYGNVNSVAVKDGIVAIAVENEVKTDNGHILFFNTNAELLNEVEAGALPDMVTFSPNGKYVLSANEGEPNDDYDVDPVGSITIVDISMGVENATAMNAGFESFNDMKEELIEAGVRIFGPNASVAQDLEPEYIAISGDSKTAYVSLQENNALAVVDIENAEVLAVVPLGYKDWTLLGNTFDASNRDDAIRMMNWPVKGMYQPDAIASFEFEGNTFIVSANEGDARDYDGYSEEDRVKDLDLDPTVFPNADYLQKDANLGRLNITTANGDIDGDGLFEEIYSYGARSISIWNSNGQLVWDSGDELETIMSEIYPDDFNSNNDENYSFDSRSDDKGPEPEGITVGKIAGKTFVFVTLERIGGVAVYNITNPYSPVFVNYFTNRDFSIDFKNPTKEELMMIGDLGPEDVKLINAVDSPNGKDLVVVSNEVSGSVSIWTAIYNFILNIEDKTTCQGEPVSIGSEDLIMYGSGDFEIQWTPTSGLDLTDPLNPIVVNPIFDRTFYLTVTDNVTGYTVYESVEVNVNAAPNVSIPVFVRNSRDTEINLNDYVTIIGDDTYTITWRDDAGNVIENPSVVTSIGLTRYFLTVTDENGCNSVEKRLIVFTSSRKDSEVILGTNGTGILEAYPTPVESELQINVEFFESVNANVKLVDLTGKTLLTLNYNNVNSIVDAIQMNQFNSGVYMLIIETPNDSFTQKVIKK